MLIYYISHNSQNAAVNRFTLILKPWVIRGAVVSCDIKINCYINARRVALKSPDLINVLPEQQTVAVAFTELGGDWLEAAGAPWCGLVWGRIAATSQINTQHWFAQQE